MKTSSRLFLILLFVVGLLALQPVRPAYAASIVVDSNTDSTIPTSGDGFCTLREAIGNANNDAATYPDCITGSGADTITFHSSLTGATINLQSTLSITSSMTIDGSSLASQIIISGDSNNNGTGDVQLINISGSPTVTLDSLKITKGSASTAGGIYNTSNTATLTIIDSTISDNKATSGAGGGIRNEGALTVMNSTISGNTSSLSGAGIRNGNLSATLTISNSTISGNTSTGGSGGGIYNVNGYLSVTIINSTISGNSAGSGGGIYYETSGTLNYANTIIANNTGGNCAGTGTIGTNIGNLVEGGGCSATATSDPNLGDLANNGGPTQTHALYPGSPAIDAGNNTTCATSPVNNLDQRGTTRPYNTVCDIGAYERTDEIAPTLDSFAATSPSTSLSIPITPFTASDDVLLSAYLITTSATTPSATDPGWTTPAPETYTVGGDGNYDLYPWARDAAGNISNLYGSPVSVTVDATPPTVSSSVRVNTSPTTANSVDFTVTFSESVTGVDPTDFNLTTTGTISSASVSGVSGSDTTYTVSVNTGSGDGTLRLDVLDDDDTIQDAITNPLNGAFSSGESYTVDKNAPTIDSFTATSPSTTLTIPITFTASDTIGVTGHMITETNTQPSAGDSGWIGGTAPTTYTVSSDGSYTLYPWAKDAIGNVSAIHSPANVIVDTISPTVVSSVRANINPTNATNVDFTVTFSESVTGVDLSDFALTSSVSGASISNVSSGPATTYTVNISTGSGNGTIRLDVLDDNTIQDGAGHFLNVGLTNGESYTTDKSAPTVSLSSTTGNPTNTSPIPVTVTFSENVTDFLASDVTLGNATLSDFVANSGTNYTFNLTPVGEGSITADITSSVANDSAGNGNTAATQFSRTYDSTAPTVSSVTRANTNPTSSASVDFTVTFSESVDGVDPTDFTLTTGVSGASITEVSGAGAIHIVSVNTGSGNGSIRLDVLDNGSIQDSAENNLADGFISGETYTIDKSVTLTLRSASAQDGWVLEASETSNTGGALNASATTFRLGDDATKKQYRGILSFNTATIPNNAVITSVTLKVKRQGVTGGGNPVTSFQGFMVDIKKGVFGTSTLQNADFQTSFSAATGKTYGPFKPALVSSWYSISLTSGNGYINKLTANSGLTQIRLRFKLDDNNNAIANYLSLYSGNGPDVNDPQLVITYYVP